MSDKVKRGLRQLFILVALIALFFGVDEAKRRWFTFKTPAEEREEHALRVERMQDACEDVTAAIKGKDARDLTDEEANNIRACAEFYRRLQGKPDR